MMLWTLHTQHKNDLQKNVGFLNKALDLSSEVFIGDLPEAWWIHPLNLTYYTYLQFNVEKYIHFNRQYFLVIQMYQFHFLLCLPAHRLGCSKTWPPRTAVQ